MAYFISDDCVSCGTCFENCPAEAIREGEVHFEIDTEKCASCGTCAENCPVKAIKEAVTEEYVAETAEDIEVEIVELPAEEETEPCYVIDYDKCLTCGSCAEQCPAEAIAMDEESRYFIDPEKCARCGGCAEQCPAEAISYVE